jgi:oligopeptide transport system substrate-binding protein
LTARARIPATFLTPLALMRTFLLLTFAVSFITTSNLTFASAVDAETQSASIALAQEPPQLNGMKATDQVSIQVLSHVMEGLTRYDRRGMLSPGVALRWEISDEKATFWLRDNARWSNGDPVTAHDFVFAWRTVVTPSTASEYAFILYPIKHAEAINRGERPATDLGVRALDDFTLEVELERPTAYFLKLTAFVSYFPVQEAFYQSTQGAYAADADKLLYNGAFRISNWVHSASLTMLKNERYWDRDAIFLNKLDHAYITADTRARLNLYVDDEIAFTRIDGETYKDALANKLRIRNFVTGSVFFLEFNHRTGRVTDNLNLRRALLAAFDPEEFVNRVLQMPGNLPGRSLFPVWLQGVEGKFRDEFPASERTPNIDEAKAYLEAAKKELGLDEIPPLALLVSDSPTATKQAEYLQGLYKSKLGLDIRIDVQTFKQRLAKMTAGEFDIVGAGWGPDFDDIMTFGDLFASWNLNNRGRYSNANYDEAVRTTMNSTDPAIRMQAMAAVQKIVEEDVVIVPLYEQGVIYLLHPKLRGVRRTVVGGDPDFTYARVVP